MLYKKLRWLAAIEQFRSATIECDFVSQICHEAALDFQIYYEKFCSERGIDISELNNDHREHLKQIYNIEDTEEVPNPLGDVTAEEETTALSVFKGTKTEEKSESVEDKEIHETFSKLFKKIAMVIHPDKLSGDLSAAERYRLTKMFKDVILGLEEKRYFVLLDAATEFKIRIPDNYALQIKWMRRQIKVIAAEAQHERKTYNYMFAESETDEERDMLVKKFLFQLFKLQVP
tara:strand:+ start:7471 stop:8166 length:696 start_codon:yes stop_codon:yes gene_type:complete